MKSCALTILLAAFCIATHASADVPRKAPASTYAALWTNSPFTSKPPPQQAGPLVDPFEDFTLSGIAPVPGGYRITIVSKKEPSVRRVIEPGSSGEFTVISVDRNPEQSLGTTVVLSTGSVQGTVRFEPDLITLKAPPAAPQLQQPQNLPPGITPGQANPDPNAAQRQPRPRIVPPPNPAANKAQQNRPSNNGNNRRSQSNERAPRR
jgi:hypothetical protein